MRAGASNTHGAFPLSAEVDALIDRAHRAGADFLGCDRDEVVFGQNATSLLLHVSRSFARTLRPGDEVVVTRLDHDANVRPWVLAARDAGATVRWVDVRADDVTLDVDSFDAQLSERTRLVAFTLASNAVGTVPPAADLIARAKAVGALVALDGVHAAQHRLIDLHGLGADLVATSPYKFFGPHQGMLGVRRELLETWEPYKLRPVEDVNPDRWETGTQSHEAMAGTVAAIEYIAGAAGGGATRRAGIEASFAAFAAHERELSRRFLAGVAEIEGVRLVGIADPARVDERTPTFAVRVGEQPPDRDLARAGRSGRLHVGGPLLRDRGLRPARAPRDRWRRADRVLPLPHARRGGSRPRRAGGRGPKVLAGALRAPVRWDRSRPRRSSMRILILGGDGYLGWPAAMRFSARGHEVHVLDNGLRRRAHRDAGTDSLTPIASLPERVAAWRELTGGQIGRHRRRSAALAGGGARVRRGPSGRRGPFRRDAERALFDEGPGPRRVHADE